MNSLEQHLADTAAYLNAQLCELNELRDQVKKSATIGPKIAAKVPQKKSANLE